MKSFALVAIALLTGIAVAQEGTAPPAPGYTSPRTTDEPVPRTVEGGKHKIKKGGKRIGEGFRGIGRGIKDVFTGQRSKEDFKKAKKIGTGARDVGEGTAG